jgi:hypothetical protein
MFAASVLLYGRVADYPLATAGSYVRVGPAANSRSEHPVTANARMESVNESLSHQNQLDVRPQGRPAQVRYKRKFSRRS